jgi:dihydrofolate reductase
VEIRIVKVKSFYSNHCQVLEITKETKYPYDGRQNYIYTRDVAIEDNSYIQTISEFEDLKKLIIEKKEEGKNIWLVGGSQLNYKLEKEGLIDQYIITVMPVILREGIPLFGKSKEDVPYLPVEYERLKLISQEVYKNGAIQNTYEKNKQ